MSKVLCVYHDACDDGFAAAWTVRRALGEDAVEFYPGVYQKEPPDVRGRDVVLVDFSYKRPVLEAMATSARSILVLDHHETAANDLAGFKKAPAWVTWKTAEHSMFGDRIAVLFDMERSGAGIAWDYFMYGWQRPRFINYVEDRDLWRKRLPDGDAFSMALRSYEMDFDIWTALVDAGPTELIKEGHAILRFYRARVADMKKSAYPATLAGHKIMIANAPYFAASEVAGEIAEGMPFGAVYIEEAPGRFKYSLRSRDGGVNVADIAASFGGGGHAKAAGFSVATPVHSPL
jgi:oligoribonuclease NrnB/cAMP/cGMP phosphodiesterase (DHH superfamily)